MSDRQWYLAKNGQQIGPMTRSELLDNVKTGNADRNTPAFTAGMSNWTPLSDIPQLKASLPEPQSAPPIPGGRIAHEIDYTIEGLEMQYSTRPRVRLPKLAA